MCKLAGEAELCTTMFDKYYILQMLLLLPAEAAAVLFQHHRCFLLYANTITREPLHLA